MQKHCSRRLPERRFTIQKLRGRPSCRQSHAPSRSVKRGSDARRSQRMSRACATVCRTSSLRCFDCRPTRDFWQRRAAETNKLAFTQAYRIAKQTLAVPPRLARKRFMSASAHSSVVALRLPINRCPQTVLRVRCPLRSPIMKFAAARKATERLFWRL